MDKQRLIILLLLALAFITATAIYFTGVWNESRTRFRTGLPVPQNILPSELVDESLLYAGGPPQAPDVRATDFLLSGSAESPVTLIVFGDFQSELSREQAIALEDALRLVGRPQDVRVVWRDLPIVSQHSKALPAAIAARCAGAQGKFKAMHDVLFQDAAQYDEFEFLRFARKINIDDETFGVCLRDPAISFAIERDVEEAQTLAITEVPTIFVNGQPIEGYLDANRLTEILRYALPAATEGS